MAHFEINYLTGDTESVTASEVGYDLDAQDYTFRNGDQLVALSRPATSSASTARTTRR